MYPLELLFIRLIILKVVIRFVGVGLHLLWMLCHRFWGKGAPCGGKLLVQIAGISTGFQLRVSLNTWILPLGIYLCGALKLEVSIQLNRLRSSFKWMKVIGIFTGWAFRNLNINSWWKMRWLFIRSPCS